MATGSYLTKGVTRTGGRKKSQLEWSSPDSNRNLNTKKGSNQGDSDSDFTLFTSSMHASTSSASSSIDRHSSGVEGRTRRNKTLEKSNSKRRWSFRSSKKNPQPPSMILPDDGSSPTRHPLPVEVSDESPLRKPVLKVTRSGSLRSLKIVRNKSRSSSGSKAPIAEDLRSNRATFSSYLKDSKFPEQVEPQAGVNESEETFPVGKLCPYQHCSLHGHHHRHEPPAKRFSFLKRRSSKDQKGVNPKTPATMDKPSSKKPEVKVIKKGYNVGSKSKKHEKAIKGDDDFSIEFYAKTRTEQVLESNKADLANIMFDVNGNNQKQVQNSQRDDQHRKKPNSINGNQMSMWRLIQQHIAESGCELDQQADKEQQSCSVDDDLNEDHENRKMFVIKIVREAIQKLLPEVPDQSISSEAISETDHHQKEPEERWSHTKKVALLKRFITELEKVKSLLPLVSESEAETVSLRPQRVSENKSSDDWMLAYALQHVISELSPTQKQKVAFLVKAFESVAPNLNDPQESSFNDENGDYIKINENGEKEKYMNMWHMVYQHVVADITSKVGSELLQDNDDDDEEEAKHENISNDFTFTPRVDDMLLIRQSVNQILLPEVQEDASEDKKDVDGGESQTQMIPKNWNKLKTLRRSIKDLESSRKLKPETPWKSVFQKEEGGKVDLRRQMSREKTKAEQWMIDYAVQHIVTKLTPARKKRVSMLVEAFEAVIPLPET